MYEGILKIKWKGNNPLCNLQKIAIVKKEDQSQIWLLHAFNFEPRKQIVGKYEVPSYTLSNRRILRGPFIVLYLLGDKAWDVY